MKNWKLLIFSFFVLLITLSFTACDSPREEEMEETETNETLSDENINIQNAIAVLAAKSGQNVQGSVNFMQTENGVEVSGEIRNLNPGKHGIHIHENGDCSDDSAKAAGGHFNPTNMPHGARTDSARHIGDLGNIEANQNGVAQFSFVDTVISLNGQYSIVGKAVVVHSGEDDLKSQPTGNSGFRVACGVIDAQ